MVDVDGVSTGTCFPVSGTDLYFLIVIAKREGVLQRKVHAQGVVSASEADQMLGTGGVAGRSERICDECQKHSSSCQWPKMKA